MGPCVGNVEHFHRVHLPLGAKDAGEAVARKIFALGPQFIHFPELPLEVQDMIWEASLEPRVFRAWGYTREDPWGGGAWRPENPEHWLVLECSVPRWKHLAVYSVCRRSRALALAVYGPAAPDNAPLFHPGLDTVEVLGLGAGSFDGGGVGISNAVSRNASEDRGIEDLRVQLGEPVGGVVVPGRRVYHADQTAHNGRKPLSSRAKWMLIGMPFRKARRVVLCHDTRYPRELDRISEWAGHMLPDTEEITVRSYVGDLGRTERGARQMGVEVDRMMRAHEEGRWPRLRTVDFTRQSVPSLQPPLSFDWDFLADV